MSNKDENSIDATKDKYESYFKDDLSAIDEELKKSQYYSGIIDGEIKKLSSSSLGLNKGSEHYLIEQIANAIQLQTQRQGLRKDKFTIKKTIMDYATKFADDKDTGNQEDLMKAIAKITEKDKLSDAQLKKSVDNENDTKLDDTIDKEIGDSKN